MLSENNALLKQIFSIPLGEGKFLIYAPLKGIAFIANPALVNLIWEHCRQCDSLSGAPGNGDLEFFRGLGLFTPEPCPEDAYVGKGVQYDAAVLFLTNQCNLRCTYCYASAGEFPSGTMTWEIAKAAIDHVAGAVAARKSTAFTLGFHGGGEPTINWEILTRATAYARALAAENRLALQVTGSFNGYWPKEVCQYVIANFTEISLSFDGLPDVQNRQRPTAGQRGSFERVTGTLAALDRANFVYGIRMTVTKDSVGRLAESIAFMCERFRPRKIQVEPVFSAGRARLDDQTVTDTGAFVEQFILGYKIAAARGIELFYSGARPDALTRRFCLAACRALVVTTQGDVTTCFETFGEDHPLSAQFIVGNYRGNGRYVIDRAKLDRHFRRTVDSISYCAGCFCKWHCAGDCAIKASLGGHVDRFRPTDRCSVNQELTKFHILERIRAGGGLVWVKKSAGYNATEVWYL